MSFLLHSQQGRLAQIPINTTEELDIVNETIQKYLSDAGGVMQAFMFVDGSATLLSQLYITARAATTFREGIPCNLTIIRNWIRTCRKQYPHLQLAISRFEESVFWAVCYDAEWTPEEEATLQQEMQATNYRPDVSDPQERMEDYVFEWLKATYGTAIDAV